MTSDSAVDTARLEAMADELQASSSQKDKEIGGRVRRVLQAPDGEVRRAQIAKLFAAADVTWYVRHVEARARVMEEIEGEALARMVRYRSYTRLVRGLTR